MHPAVEPGVDPDQVPQLTRVNNDSSTRDINRTPFVSDPDLDRRVYAGGGHWRLVIRLTGIAG